MRRILLWCAATLVAAGAAVFVLGEFYRLSATSQHPLWVYRGLAAVRDTIVAFGSADVEVPESFDPVAAPAGAALYEKHCVQCHGAPGVPPQEFALGMMPVPTNLVGAARDRTPAEIYWFVRYGLKMSGMPAWDLRMSDADIWRVTAFVTALPTVAPEEYALLLDRAGGGADAVTPVAEAVATSDIDPERGRLAMQVYGCASCHVIPGIVGPRIRVGPSLEDVGGRGYIAGVLPNSRENLARWISEPDEVDPLTAMPDLGVGHHTAREMAAYLYSTTPDAEARRRTRADSPGPTDH